MASHPARQPCPALKAGNQLEHNPGLCKHFLGGSPGDLWGRAGCSHRAVWTTILLGPPLSKLLLQGGIALADHQLQEGCSAATGAQAEYGGARGSGTALMGCSQQQAAASPKAGRGAALALQLLALLPRSQVGPGASHCNALGAPLPPLLWQERQQWLGQEETLLSNHPAPTRPVEGARAGSMLGEKSPT